MKTRRNPARAAEVSRSARSRAGGSFFRAPRWLVVLVAFAVSTSFLAITDAPVAANESQCTTSTYGESQEAKDNFINDCGAPFQETPAFSCTYVDAAGGWQCTGPGTQQTTTPPPANAAPAGQISNGQCSTNVYGDAQEAKDNFINDCGAPFQETPAAGVSWNGAPQLSLIHI